MMWARVVEVMLGCWLIISPFVFRHGPGEIVLWTADLLAGFVVIFLALLSCWERTRLAHLVTVVFAVGMVLYGRFYIMSEPPPALQNHILVGVLLMMFALIPNHASEPPKAWYAAKRPDY